MTQEVVDRLLDPTQAHLFTINLPYSFILWCQSGSPRWSGKTLNFQTCFQGRKSQKKYPQALQKTQKIDPRNTKTQFLWKHGFCNTFRTKTLFSELQLSIIPLKNRCKKWPGNKLQKNTEFNPSELKKLSKWVPEIKPKSLKILLRTPTCPSCCSHGPPGCPQADKMVPRVVKCRQQASKW